MDKEKITNGEDISLDNGNVIVLNNISVAEKVSEEVKKVSEESKEEQKVETPSIEAKEAPEVTPIVGAVNVEMPTATTIATPAVSEPIIPTIDNVIPKEVEFSNDGTPISITNDAVPTPSIEIPVVPEADNSANLNTPVSSNLNEPTFSNPTLNNDFNYGVNVDNFTPNINNFNSGNFETSTDSFSNNTFSSDVNNFNSNDYSANSFDKFSNYNNTSFGGNSYADSGTIPGNIETALVSLRSEVLNTVGEVTHLKEENSRLTLENEDLKRQLGNKDDEVRNLKTSMMNMENQVKTMQARVLDMFGMGNIKQNSDYYGQSGNNMNPYGQNSYNDDSSNIKNMAA